MALRAIPRLINFTDKPPAGVIRPTTQFVVGDGTIEPLFGFNARQP
jgi:hypothetical protein